MLPGAQPLYAQTPTTPPAAPPLNLGGNLNADAKSTGTIKGIVKFAGEKKPRKEIPTAADARCAAHHNEPLLSETYVWGDDDTLQNVLVYVEKGIDAKMIADGMKANIEKNPPRTLDQIGCCYVPHVQAIVVAQPLLVRNTDDTIHNVRSVGVSNPDFNLAQPTQGSTKTVSFNKPEMGIRIKCDVHPWMNAYLHVLENPFYAITQQSGTFEIRGLPPGDYTIKPWHELPAFVPDQPEYQVKIEAGKTANLTIIYNTRKRAN